jgi:N4-gp56 family major capsid protein
MPTQTYSLVPSRNLIRAELKMLKHAESYQVLGSFGMQEEQPLRSTDTVVFRRLDPYNMAANGIPQITAANFLLAEGAIPPATTISYTDVSVTLRQYAVLFKLTSKAALMYEDDIPGDMQKLTGETLGEVCELVAYGEFRAGTTVVYSNGSSRAAVNTAISLPILRQCTRTLETNRGKKVTTSIKPGPNFATQGVEPAFIVFCHTDLASDIRDLPHFTARINYGTAIKPVHEREFGACEEFRFVSSSLLTPFLAAGSAVLNGMSSAGGANVDVYPSLIIAEECWGHVSLKGHGKTSISPTYLPPSQKSHANPSGTFGYVGADFWYAACRANENWFVRLESGASDLTP